MVRTFDLTDAADQHHPSRPAEPGALLAAPRVRVWCWLFATGALVLLTAIAIGTGFGAHATPSGLPPGTDFVSFWTASRLALTGPAALVWDPAYHAAAQWALPQVNPRVSDEHWAFFYPPPFLLLLLPLGLLPYVPALLAWLALTTGAYALSLRSLLGSRAAWLPVLAFPAVILNAAHGQNAALTTALFAAAATWLDRRPTLAGLCLGVLCIKPQLAILIGPGLLAAGRWRALAGLAASSSVLTLASLALFGTAAWAAFWQHTADATQALQDGVIGHAKMVSVFAALRLLGADLSLAWAGQVLSAAIATPVFLRIVRAKPGPMIELAACVVATALAVPFMLDYDLLLMALPLAVLARHRATPSSGRLAAATFALPIFTRPIGFLGIPVAPFVLAALLASLARLAALERATPRRPPAVRTLAPHRT